MSLGPPDAILGLNESFAKDKNPQKVNLGAGTYRDDAGKPFLLPSVVKAEQQVLSTQTDKEYLPIAGHPSFRQKAAELALGSKAPLLKSKRVSYVYPHV